MAFSVHHLLVHLKDTNGWDTGEGKEIINMQLDNCVTVHVTMRALKALTPNIQTKATNADCGYDKTGIKQLLQWVDSIKKQFFIPKTRDFLIKICRMMS